MGKLTICIAIVVTLNVAAQAGTKCNDASKDPVCKLPQMGTSTAADGYVSARGTWTPDGFIDRADVEIECVRTHVPQLSLSKTGFCQMATALIFQNAPMVSTNVYDIVSWGRTKIIAERSESWQSTNCETQQLVLDFPSNTVTLTSTLNRSGRCGKFHEDVDKLSNKPVKDVEVFTLVHKFGDMFADQDDNSFFRKPN